MTSYKVDARLVGQTTTFVTFSIFLGFIIGIVYWLNPSCGEVLFEEYAWAENITLVLYGVTIIWFIKVRHVFPPPLRWCILLFMLIMVASEGEIPKLIRGALFDLGYIEQKRIKIYNLFQGKESVNVSLLYVFITFLPCFLITFLFVSNIKTIIQFFIQKKSYKNNSVTLWGMLFVVTFVIAQIVDNYSDKNLIYTFWRQALEELIEMTMPAQFWNLIIRLAYDNK